MSRTDALQISPRQPGVPLTPARKRFNTLIRQIDRARQTLTAWQEGTQACRQSYVKVLQPLQTALLEGQRQWVHMLDAAICTPGWTKAEVALLREVLCDAAAELLEGQAEDATLKALYDKHAEVDFDTEQRDGVRAMKELAEMMTGLDLGDDEGLESETDLFKRMQQSMRQQVAREEAEDAEEAEDEQGEAWGQPARRRAAKAASQRQSAAQQRREAEAQQARQSVREIYRKLASALHPDRQTDERQRESNTALMQRVNQAYEAQDLLTLLELQLQIEQIDAGHMAGASEAKVKHYNKVLGEQLAELKAEIESVEMTFRMEFGLHPGWGLNPAKLGLVLEQTRRAWQADLAHRLQQHRMLEDQAATKRWLKSVRKQRREEAYDDLPF
jgi:hypothetical protein